MSDEEKLKYTMPGFHHEPALTPHHMASDTSSHDSKKSQDSTETISTIKSPSSKPETQKQIKVKGKPDINSTVIEKKPPTSQEEDHDKTLVNQEDDKDSGLLQSTFVSSQATITTNISKTPLNRKKKTTIQSKPFQKSKHTLSTDTSYKQSDTSETREKQSKATNLVSIDTAFDKRHTETLYRQRLPDFNNTKETLASLHEKRLTRIGVDPEMVRLKKKEADREKMLTERATTARNPKETTIYDTNKSDSDQQHLPITPFRLPPNVTSADLEGYINHRAQNPFNAATNAAAETTIPNQNTTTDNELRLNERIHKYWKDKYEKIRQQQQQELDHTIYSFNAKESKLLSKQIKTNEKLYQVQLEQDQLKKELEEAKLQLEQVRLQNEDTTSSSEDDERQ